MERETELKALDSMFAYNKLLEAIKYYEGNGAVKFSKDFSREAMAKSLMDDFIKHFGVPDLGMDKLRELTIDLVDKNFPKGECKERGKAIVLYAEILIAIQTAFQKASGKTLTEGV